MNGRTIWLANADGTRRNRLRTRMECCVLVSERQVSRAGAGSTSLANEPKRKRAEAVADRGPRNARTANRAEASPSWSPDGRSLVFEHREREPGSWGATSVWVADLDGQNLNGAWRRRVRAALVAGWDEDLVPRFPVSRRPSPGGARRRRADGSNDRNLGQGGNSCGGRPRRRARIRGVRFRRCVRHCPIVKDACRR